MNMLAKKITYKWIQAHTERTNDWSVKVWKNALEIAGKGSRDGLGRIEIKKKPAQKSKQKIKRNTFKLNVHQDMFVRTCVVNVYLYTQLIKTLSHTVEHWQKRQMENHLLI